MSDIGQTFGKVVSLWNCSPPYCCYSSLSSAVKAEAYKTVVLISVAVISIGNAPEWHSEVCYSKLHQMCIALTRMELILVNVCVYTSCVCAVSLVHHSSSDLGSSGAGTKQQFSTEQAVRDRMSGKETKLSIQQQRYTLLSKEIIRYQNCYLIRNNVVPHGRSTTSIFRFAVLAWEAELEHLQRVKLPRCYSSPMMDHHGSVRNIQVFSNASEQAYIAVAYLRTENQQSDVKVSFLEATVNPSSGAVRCPHCSTDVQGHNH